MLPKPGYFDFVFTNSEGYRKLRVGVLFPGTKIRLCCISNCHHCGLLNASQGMPFVNFVKFCYKRAVLIDVSAVLSLSSRYIHIIRKTIAYVGLMCFLL
jgi:hypothetical protein